MLHADKEALRTAYKLRLLAIREKELNYFLQNCINIATLAAMLAGFAQSGLIYTKVTGAIQRAIRRSSARNSAQFSDAALTLRCSTSTKTYAVSAKSGARSCSTRSSSSS